MFAMVFKTDNTAFDGREASETARLLREIAARIECGELDGACRDRNGNTIGQYLLNDADTIPWPLKR